MVHGTDDKSPFIKKAAAFRDEEAAASRDVKAAASRDVKAAASRDEEAAASRDELSRAASPITLSIQTKFAIGSTFVFATTVALGFATVLVLQMRQLERAHNDRVTMLTSTLRESMMRAMLTGGIEELHKLFAAYGTHSGRGDADVINRDNHIVATTRPVPVGGRYPFEILGRFSGPQMTDTELGGESVTLRIEPLRNSRRCHACHNDVEQTEILGYLVVQMSRRALESQIDSLRDSLLLSAAVTLVLLLVASRIMLSVLVVEPVEELAKQMQRAADGELAVELPSRTPADELTWVATCFTTMMRRLAEARAALEQTYRDRLVRADRFATVGELASGLAHEIKNPLAGLSGALQILSQEFTQGSEQREVAGEMQRQIQRLDRTVNSLLRFARPRPALLQPTDVNPVIERVVSLLSKQTDAAKVAIHVDLRAETPSHADASQLEQVFLNLGLNAIQAMPDGGELRVASREEPGHVVVEFADTGLGIASSVRADIFKPFFSTKTAGTGLGLAICNRIIADHKGRITVDCPAQGGARFAVKLPRVSFEQHPSAEES